MPSAETRKNSNKRRFSYYKQEQIQSTYDMKLQKRGRNPPKPNGNAKSTSNWKNVYLNDSCYTWTLKDVKFPVSIE